MVIAIDKPIIVCKTEYTQTNIVSCNQHRWMQYLLANFDNQQELHTFAFFQDVLFYANDDVNIYSSKDVDTGSVAVVN